MFLGNKKVNKFFPNFLMRHLEEIILRTRRGCKGKGAYAIIKAMSLEESLDLIRNTIYKHFSREEYEAFVYGSRADGTAQKWSDIDVGIRGKERVPGSLIETVREELEESDIPYKVEVVDFAKVSDKFRGFAQKEVVEL